MKKKRMYVKPEFQVVELETSLILAASPGDTINPSGYSVQEHKDGGSLGTYEAKFDY